MTRSGDFSPKNATNFGYFPANLQNVLGYSSAKILILAFFGTFWLLLGTKSGSTDSLRENWGPCLIQERIYWLVKPKCKISDSFSYEPKPIFIEQHEFEIALALV